jgi:hypothetical protein
VTYVEENTDSAGNLNPEMAFVVFHDRRPTALVHDGTAACCADPTPGYHAKDAYNGTLYCESCDATWLVVEAHPAA